MCPVNKISQNKRVRTPYSELPEEEERLNTRRRALRLKKKGRESQLVSVHVEQVREILGYPISDQINLTPVELIVTTQIKLFSFRRLYREGKNHGEHLNTVPKACS